MLHLPLALASRPILAPSVKDIWISLRNLCPATTRIPEVAPPQRQQAQLFWKSSHRSVCSQSARFVFKQPLNNTGTRKFTLGIKISVHSALLGSAGSGPGDVGSATLAAGSGLRPLGPVSSSQNRRAASPCKRMHGWPLQVFVTPVGSFSVS